MRILILQQPRSAGQFESWLLEALPGIELRMVTGAGTVRSDGEIAPGVAREIAGDYWAAETTRRIFEICGQWRPDAIFSNAEADVLRAAEARTLFGIRGMKSSSAVLFRDKVAMKQLFRDVVVDGLPVHPVSYRTPASGDDILTAIDDFGTMVLKPRDGAGATGVRVFATRQQVLQTLAAEPALLPELHRSMLILERYIEGDVYHVDILLRDGAPIMISPSRYLAPPHTFRQHNVGSVMTDLGSDEHTFLTRYAQALTSRIGPAHEPVILHLEMYRTADGEYLAGEIACRGGGGLIKEGIRHTYGVDQAQAACLLNAGLLPDREFLERTGPQTGWVMETARPIPVDPADPPGWVPLVRVRERPSDPRTSVDGGLRVLVEGGDGTEIMRHLSALESGSPLAAVPEHG